MRLSLFITAFLSSLALISAQEVRTRVVPQPILEYRLSGPGQSLEHSPEGELILNGFIAYTHIGTDFGFHGEGVRFLNWEDQRICMTLKAQTQWVGMWHSLSGMAGEGCAMMNFDACYPPYIVKAGQPRVRALVVKAMGAGQLKLEVKSATQNPIWTHLINISDADSRPISVSLDEAPVRDAKFLNWTAEPGSDVCLRSLGMELEMPALPFDKYVLLASYAKLARCYDPMSGLAKDRAHIVSGAFDSVPATGLFALATALMSQPDVALVEPSFAHETLRKIYTTVAAIPTGTGLLPHFVRREEGGVHIHPGTEFSTVDSALYFHSMLLASELLGDKETTAGLLKAIRAIDFKKLRLRDGVISHGVKDDGTTVLEHGWADWGGETALVVLLESLSGADLPTPMMKHSGLAWQGTGFITELQSLFFPDFDSTVKDAVSGVNWHEARTAMLSAQKAYFPKSQPQCQVAKLGIYGLSAGEGRGGISYSVGGVELPDQQLLHPHYVLMAGALDAQPKDVYDLLQRMEVAGYFPPWGMVENLTADGVSYLPMISALNAGFETLGAYHLFTKNRKITDSVYQASRESAELRRAMKVFYPAGVVSR